MAESSGEYNQGQLQRVRNSLKDVIGAFKKYGRALRGDQTDLVTLARQRGYGVIGVNPGYRFINQQGQPDVINMENPTRMGADNKMYVIVEKEGPPGKKRIIDLDNFRHDVAAACLAGKGVIIPKNMTSYMPVLDFLNAYEQATGKSMYLNDLIDRGWISPDDIVSGSHVIYFTYILDALIKDEITPEILERISKFI